MVLDEDVAEAATYGEVDPIDTWIRNLDRPEDINEVDANGMTALNLCVKGVGNHFDDEDTDRGRSFEELRLLDYQQGNQVRRVCADCGRSLARENYSNTQWIKKRVGDSRCKECIGDLSGLAPTLASLRFD